LEDKKFYIYIDSKLAIENYPNIKAHLQRFRPILRAREQVRNDENNWFWIRGAKRKYFVNTGHHILCPYRAKENSFAFSDVNILGAGDVYFITQKNDKSFNLKYILALLNAKLFYFWLFHKGKRKGNILELYQKPLSNIPIKIMSDDGQKPFMEMVDRILSLTLSKDYLKNQPKQQKVQEYQKQIDKMLYKLYDLNDNEIELVDNFSKQK
jgi:adenine-specific DNA-methyltransferase